MASELDILVKECRLRGGANELVDIGIREGRIQAIAADISDSAVETIQANGNLATESFVNPHLHLDKVFTLTMLDDAAMLDYHGDSMGKAMTAIERASEVKQSYQQDWIVENPALGIGNQDILALSNRHLRQIAGGQRLDEARGIRPGDLHLPLDRHVT